MLKGSKTGVAATGRIEVVGHKFNRLTVLEAFHRPGKEQLFYRCQCDCGKVVEVLGQSVRRGNTMSCGCYHKERTSEISKTHGMSHTSIHNTWWSMLCRCNNPKNDAYADYGGRGIKVCERWHTFENFLEDMGLPPQKGLTLDRFPDNDGNYEPGNVRWATKKEQANNRRSSKLLTFNGETHTQAEWEDLKGLRRGQLWERLDRGWSLERSLGENDGF